MWEIVRRDRVKADLNHSKSHWNPSRIHQGASRFHLAGLKGSSRIITQSTAKFRVQKSCAQVATPSAFHTRTMTTHATPNPTGCRSHQRLWWLASFPNLRNAANSTRIEKSPHEIAIVRNAQPFASRSFFGRGLQKVRQQILTFASWSCTQECHKISLVNARGNFNQNQSVPPVREQERSEAPRANREGLPGIKTQMTFPWLPVT